jgi:hypothetical protein
VRPTLPVHPTLPVAPAHPATPMILINPMLRLTLRQSVNAEHGCQLIRGVLSQSSVRTIVNRALIIGSVTRIEIGRVTPIMKRLVTITDSSDRFCHTHRILTSTPEKFSLRLRLSHGPKEKGKKQRKEQFDLAE